MYLLLHIVLKLWIKIFCRKEFLLKCCMTQETQEVKYNNSTGKLEVGISRSWYCPPAAVRWCYTFNYNRLTGVTVRKLRKNKRQEKLEGEQMKNNFRHKCDITFCWEERIILLIWNVSKQYEKSNSYHIENTTCLHWNKRVSLISLSLFILRIIWYRYVNFVGTMQGFIMLKQVVHTITIVF